MCGVRCVRATPAVAFGELSPSERQFEEWVHDGVLGLLTTVALISPALFYTNKSCAKVDALDALVQQGHVRRRVAAAMASRIYMHHAHAQFGIGYMAGMCKPHGPACRCLHKVLQWGTCPHVYLVQQASPQSVQVLTYLAHRFYITSTAQEAIRAYGGLPVDYLDVAVCAGPDGAVLGNVYRAELSATVSKHMDDAMERAQGMCQWRRWHGRQRRQEWLACSCPVVGTRTSA